MFSCPEGHKLGMGTLSAVPGWQSCFARLCPDAWWCVMKIAVAGKMGNRHARFWCCFNSFYLQFIFLSFSAACHTPVIFQKNACSHIGPPWIMSFKRERTSQRKVTKLSHLLVGVICGIRFFAKLLLVGDHIDFIWCFPFLNQNNSLGLTIFFSLHLPRRLDQGQFVSWSQWALPMSALLELPSLLVWY